MKRPMMIIIAVSVLVSEIIWQGYKRCRNLGWKGSCKRSVIEKKKKSLAEVLLFTEDSAFCRSHINSENSCNRLNCAAVNFNKLKKYLNSAKCTIDVCIYFFTSQKLGNAIIKAHKRGVAVRVIIDATMAQNDGSQAVSFRKASIKVRTKYSKDLMHHKFVIIDNDILITGSANWTMQAFFGNFENIIVTNCPILLKQFVNEFERLWKRYDKDLAQSDSFPS
ncbi:hypothetical protein KPH14_011847 [Odynerus spinipes]|uniref:Mitochondrial cardiolipin hydrolase n=1 Tax=Odynerus spinipes TaxID=1348599 RepID=A0AAD9RW21_9HYME|nr:hypothetical protein KPH14_011847 [Odynerus spinipes]